MNDVGFVITEYAGSECAHATERADIDQLVRRRRVTEFAIWYHEREMNPKQVAFFAADLSHIDRRIEKLKRAAK